MVQGRYEFCHVTVSEHLVRYGGDNGPPITAFSFNEDVEHFLGVPVHVPVPGVIPDRALLKEFLYGVGGGGGYVQVRAEIIVEDVKEVLAGDEVPVVSVPRVLVVLVAFREDTEPEHVDRGRFFHARVDVAGDDRGTDSAEGELGVVPQDPGEEQGGREFLCGPVCVGDAHDAVPRSVGVTLAVFHDPLGELRKDVRGPCGLAGAGETVHDFFLHMVWWVCY